MGAGRKIKNAASTGKEMADIFARGAQDFKLVRHPSGKSGLETTYSGGKIIKPSAKFQDTKGNTYRSGGGLTDGAKVAAAGSGTAATYGGLYASKKPKDKVKKSDPFNVEKAHRFSVQEQREMRAQRDAASSVGGLAGGAAGLVAGPKVLRASKVKSSAIRTGTQIGSAVVGSVAGASAADTAYVKHKAKKAQVKKMDDPFNIDKAYSAKKHNASREKESLKGMALGTAGGAAAGAGASRLKQGVRAGKATTRGLNNLQSGGRAGNVMAGVRNTAGVAGKVKGRPLSAVIGGTAGMYGGALAGDVHGSKKYLKANPKKAKVEKAFGMGALSAGMKLGQKAAPKLGAGISRAGMTGKAGVGRAGAAGMAGAQRMGASRPGQMLKARPIAAGAVGGVAAAGGAAAMNKPKQPKPFGKSDPFEVSKANPAQWARGVKYTSTGKGFGNDVVSATKGRTGGKLLKPKEASSHQKKNFKWTPTSTSGGGLTTAGKVAAGSAAATGAGVAVAHKKSVKKSLSSHDAFGI